MTAMTENQLEQETLGWLADVGYGTPITPVPTGLYVMRYDDSSKILTLTKNQKKSGGSHQEAWQLWDELVEKLRAQTNADATEYARISLDLAEHKRFLTRSTAKYNPPEIRGEINYQFKGGSWVFEKDSAKSIRTLQQSIVETHPLVTSRLATPEGLVANNRIIIGLAKALFMHACEKYPNSFCRSLSNKYKSYIG